MVTDSKGHKRDATLRELREHWRAHPHCRAEIDAALERLDNGSYGFCVECHEPIAPRRLKAVPWAKFCARCQDVLAAMSSRL